MKVKCLECEKEFDYINTNHLNFKHNMTTQEYKKKHPDCKTGKKQTTKKIKETVILKYGVENISQLDSVKKIISKKLSGRKLSRKIKLKISQSHKGKTLSMEHKKKISLRGKLSIEYIEKKYPFFLKIEEIRYNPEKLEEKEMQVHCKNHKCKNSKERGGWFTPTGGQLSERLRHYNVGNDGSYFYCSEECKLECPLFNLRPGSVLNNKNKKVRFYTTAEYNQFRDFVLERDNYICQYCEDLATDVHHEKPQKLEPFFSLDPDFAWSCCQKCHSEKGHKDECSKANLANKICYQ